MCLKLISLVTFLAQDDTSEMSNATAAGVSVGAIVGGFVFGCIIAGILLWGVFKKAGQPPWAGFVPIMNVYCLCKVAGRPGWWFILLLLPCVNFIIAIILGLDIAKAFGKGTGFAVGLIILPIIFYPILGFGSATYVGRPGATA